MKVLRVLGNILWFFTIGLALYLGEIAAGFVSFITILPIFFGIPRVHFNNARFFLAPFGKKVETHYLGAPIRNTISFIFGGFINGLLLLIFAGLFCITIVGIPVGKVLFGAAKLSLAPFHAQIVKK